MLILFSVVCLINSLGIVSSSTWGTNQIPQRQLLQYLLEDVSLTAKLGELTEYINLHFTPCLQWGITFSMCLRTETDQKPSLESKPATLGRNRDELHREEKTAGGLTFLRDF